MTAALDTTALTTTPSLANLIATMEASWAAFSKLVDAPNAEGEADTASDAHMATVAAVRSCQSQSWGELWDKATALSKVSGNIEVEARENYAAVLRDFGALMEAAGPAPAPSTDQFEVIRTAYEAVRLAYDRLPPSDHSTAFDQLLAACPLALKRPASHTEGSWFYRWDEDSLNEDPLLGREEREALRQLLRPWTMDRQQLRDAACSGRDHELDERSERLYDQVGEVEQLMMETPAPTVAALAYKALLAAKEADDDKLGFADLGLVCFKEHHYLDDRYQVVTCRDLLRLAGIDHPMVEMTPFDPGSWIKAYEQAGGLVSCIQGALIMAYPTPDNAAALKLRSEAAAIPWAFRAIYLTAEARRNEGGDPMVDSRGDFGRQDRRRGRSPFFGPVAHADAVYFRHEGGSLVAAVEHRINGLPAQWRDAIMAGQLDPEPQPSQAAAILLAAE